MTTSSPSPELCHNIAERLTCAAAERPEAVAIAVPGRYGPDGRRRYEQITFGELEARCQRLARGLVALGVRPGTRMALFVRPSIDFIALVFALFRSGAVTILIDPGMGRRNLLACLDAVEPEGFVAIPAVHAVRTLLGRRFAKARFNVTVGRRWGWGGVNLDELLRLASDSDTAWPTVAADDPAAIIFTTGSTGPPKGVLYRHGMFDAQVEQIRDTYQIAPGEVDLPGFPLFGLFNGAMGVTTVIPDMDPSRPARIDPAKVVETVADWKITQAFGSPAIWNRVGRYCEETGARLPTLRRVLSAGAPVPAHVLKRMKASIHPEGDVHTPYGATESLPVATISASEVLSETAAETRRGAGVCVGHKFSDIQWQVIRIVDGPIGSLEEVEPLPAGEPGELIVRGPQVTWEYVTRTDWNHLAKIHDGETVWHRIGDVGYFDQQGRFWFCGRVAHRVQTAQGTLYTVPCEAIFNEHPDVNRSALVGVGTPGAQRPVIVAEPHAGRVPRSASVRARLVAELRELGAAYDHTAGIDDFLIHRSLPVDIRHNAKIRREQLAVWAAKQISGAQRFSQS